MCHYYNDFMGSFRVHVFSLQRLVDCHDKVKKLLKIHRPLELSMGMSGDYEHAVSIKCFVTTFLCCKLA